MIDEEIVTARIAKIREYGRLLADFEEFCKAIVYFLQSRSASA